MANARISLPSDRSFDTYEGALARVRGAKLPDTTQVYYNQGFLDLELHFPIQSHIPRSRCVCCSGAVWRNRTATYINFIRPDGAVRAFRIHDDTPLVRLDPKAHQAGWVFLKAGFYRFLDGLDHLLFVIVLALPFRRVRDLVKPFAAFAIAHSITLVLAAFGLAPVDTWFVPTIGALIGALACVRRDRKRGRDPFNSRGSAQRPPSCASVDRRARLRLVPRSRLRDRAAGHAAVRGSHAIVALVAYNVGLELGTLIILAIIVPAANLLFAQRRARSAPASSCRRCSSATSAGTG